MSIDAYRQQLAVLARAMALPNLEERVVPTLDQQHTAEQVKMFVDGNLEKRFEKLQKQVSFLADGFPDLEDRIAEYMMEQPLVAYDTGTSDGERLLAWLQGDPSLSLEQEDFITCQRTRHRIEELARQDRLRFVEFQDRWTLVETFLHEWEQRPSLRIYLNPIRAWARFHTAALLDEDASPPADVLFFAAAGDVATAFFELEGQVLLNELADYQPCTLAEWSAVSGHPVTSELEQFARELARMGLVSLG